MAKAYKCDVCGKLVENCYKISGLDIFLNRLMDSRINEEKHIEISECCKDCYEKIHETVKEIWKENHATTK